MAEKKKWATDTRKPIKEILDKAILENREVKKREYFYASDAMQCPRKIYYQFKLGPDVTEIDDPRTLRIFDNGDSVHDRLKKYFAQAGILIDDEVDIPTDELNIHGRLDVLFRYGAEIRVGEFKSINLKTLLKPKEEHVAQIQLYLHYTKIPKGMILYESKQTQELFSFDVSYDPNLVMNILDWFKDLKKNIDTDTLPEVKYNKLYYPCSTPGGFTCPFYDACWKKDASPEETKVDSPKPEDLDETL